ncbi:MAG TPA: hypothetical protein VNW71_03070 [Thermoanaerobaculia bacterium]|nr:hypothetical protein [Thermoanaerobaculia bacterium]
MREVLSPGEPVRGTWFDRTAEHRAKLRRIDGIDPGLPSTDLEPLRKKIGKATVVAFGESHKPSVSRRPSMGACVCSGGF